MAAWFCRVLGVCFLVLGVWGFQTVDRVWLFDVNPLHNIIHVVSGSAALWAGYSAEKSARVFALLFSTVYAGLAVSGFLDVPAVVDLLNLNMPGNWLHATMATLFLAAALGSSTATAGGLRGSGIELGSSRPRPAH
ncbi:MAG: hypothetical protein AMXMBFR13_21760 [Phycisphaerae bacterium]